MSWSRSLPIAARTHVVGLFILTMAGSAHGADKLWLTPTAGPFGLSTKWLGGVPGPFDGAVFGLQSGNVPFQVTFAAPTTVGFVRVEDQRPVFLLGGNSLTSQGTIWVSGTNAQSPALTLDGAPFIASWIEVGRDGGVGTLALQNGASWEGGIVVGHGAPGSEGHLVVSGSTTSVRHLDSSGTEFRLGDGAGASATMRVEAGASLTMTPWTYANLGSSGGDATLTVTGDDSALNFELGGGGEFRLGWWGGHGALRLEDGASAALSSLNVGASGSGELVMSGGATLTTTCCGYVGSGLGSVATATLSGLGTKWTGVGVDAVTAGEFGSTGSIAVLDGAAIEAEGFQLANEGGLSGSLLVSGRGSVVHTGGFSTAGVPDASAEFDIVDAGLLEIEGFGFLSFAGSTAGTIDGAGSRLDCDADFVVGSGEGGDALVTVSNGGTLETGGILYALRGLQDVNPAALVVDGAGSKVLAGGRLYVRGDKPGTSVIVRHGAQASLFSGATLGEFGSPCELRAESGAQIVSLGGLSVGAGAGVAPDVKFSIRDPGTSVTFEASPCYVDAGLVECVDAAVFSALELNVGWGGEADLHVSGSAFVGVFGRLTLGNIGNGEGTLHVSGAGSLVSCGSDLVSGFDGTGHISISEGAFVATAGNYYQELDSSLSVEFGLDSSAAPLFVLGTANLGGTLSVQFLRGAELEVGETRLIIDAGAVNGVFATTSLPPQHEVSYGPAGVSIVRVASVLGDLNNDGLVGGSDLAELLGAWGNSGAADLNGDGVVDAADLALLLGAWSGA